ncbi:hypothetical protein [Melissococcus plutonius]|uniref:hypothetical protein n=1 Tax=Melissococcus plutonius TaxID=33970 RepID=UPI000669D919|nr:hypothetical protein [Melissococcus plutonius]KMT33288.1 hypothetical protein MEPL6_1c03230 [Melissococcus plutonius]KMT33634.1 hypothetical protein MEPL8_7c00720 [Melissococcus plutonius]KMT39003.1 hypothetical protein MEPL12_5c01090 [Melissococcus plutonius]BBD15640.1 hypothetical protein DAT585_1343 [Melissococcus plutonius]
MAVSWFVVIDSAFNESFKGKGGATQSTATFFYVMVGIGLILHLIAISKSKKAGISIIGHILGIIGCALFVCTMLLALPSFILLILAAVYTLMQKNSDNFSVKVEETTNIEEESK